MLAPWPKQNRTRSSPHNWVVNYDPRAKRDWGDSWTPGYKIIKKIIEMVDPAPAKTYVLLDERDDSINDSYCVVTMDGFPNQPRLRNIV